LKTLEVKMVPVGDLSPRILSGLGPTLSESFGGRLRLLPSPRVEVPSMAYRKERGQYEASIVLKEVLRQCKGRILAITEVDLYTPGLNFVFGLAQCPGRGALVSLRRLSPSFYGEEGREDLFFERSVKEAVHELGHTFGLGHCRRRECVMSFSNSVLEVDLKRKDFCRECREKLEGILLNLITSKSKE